MKKKAYLYWWKYPKENGNYGDELNPYIFSRLTNATFNHINIRLLWNDAWLAFKILTKQFRKKKISLKEYIRYVILNIQSPTIYVGIGSVIQLLRYKKSIVWGAGIIRKQVSIPDAHFLSVRGPKTLAAIKDQNIKPPKVMGDPALLLPMIYQPEKNSKKKLGIIPHFSHFSKMKDLETKDCIVINLLDPIEKITDEITNCEITFSTSLHGIVVSHAYGIPSVWFTDSEDKLTGDDIKFIDYFLSVNIQPYRPLNTKDLTSDIHRNLELITSIESDALLPSKAIIEKIQVDLLKCFPFPLKNEIASSPLLSK